MWRPPPPVNRGGAGTPLVLLHAGMMTWRAWVPVLPLLEAHHEVFAPTLPGHCGGEALGDGVEPSIRALADALERQLDDAGIADAHVAGNSLGGWLALELARRRRARSVVAFSPPAAGTLAMNVLHQFLFRAGTLALRGVAPMAPWLGRTAVERRLVLRFACERGDRVEAAEMKAMLQAAAACRIGPAWLRTVTQWGALAPGLDRSSCPILIAWGERDRLTPYEQFARPLLELVPTAEAVVLPGVGHVPMYDDPELVAGTILGVTRAVDLEGGRRVRSA